MTNAPSTPLSTATVPSAGARIDCCGCTNPPLTLIRPTTWSAVSSAPCVARQSISVPLAGAFTAILLPSICALSVET